jgi:RimJ/RimL family protein N-acetyltransferase
VTPVWGMDDLVVPFVAALAGEPPDFGNCRTMAIMNGDGEMVAGIVFHNWRPDHGVMEVSAAALDPKWATRGVLREAFGYIFDKAGCQLAVARTAEGNTRVRRLWRAFGATEYIIPRLRGRSASEAILTVTKEAWALSPLAR